MKKAVRMGPLVCGALAAFAMAGCHHGAGSGPDASAGDRDRAIAAAKTLFQQKKAQGVDMTNGPCLGLALPDWCLDIAHTPRQPVDDDPANECREYRDGHVHHFVELDPNGNLIRAL